MGEIAVIGGGPAGSTVATLLAQRGFRVDLYEAAQFPRPHIGESLLPATIEALEVSGVADKVRAAGFTVKNGATMAWGVDHDLWDWYFRETNTKQPHAFQVNRDEFDHILLQHAETCGVHVHERTSVDRVRFDGEIAVGIELDGVFEPFDYVVDASGQRAVIANQKNARSWDKEFRNLAVYRYYRGGSHMDGDSSGNILVESVDAGWLWKIPLKDDVSSVGVVADREVARAAIATSSIDVWFHDVVDSSAYTSSFLAGSAPVGPCNATRDWSYSAHQFTGPRHCLIGDAACFIDPLFSTGVHLAIYSATLAAALVGTTIRATEIAELAAEAFERQYRQHYSHFRELAKLFYGSNQSIDSYFWQTRRITGESEYSPRAAFVRAVSGQASHGYERTTLSHGVLPDVFTSAIAGLEGERQERQTKLKEISDSTPLRVTDAVSVEKVAVFTGELFELGFAIRRSELDDLPISAFVAQVIESLQAPVDPMGIAAALAERGWDAHTIQNSLGPTLELLLVEGIVVPEFN